MIATDIQLPQLFDTSMNPIKRLHPSKAGYDLNKTPLSSASLTLDTESVEQGQFVRMFETYGAIDVFRVAKTKSKYLQGTRNQSVTLEHVLATLSDVLIPGYFEFGGTGITTTQVLTQLLALQTTTYWVLGTCEYSDEYQYSVENELLINAILSVASPLTTPYRWTFDTSIFPFVLSLVQASSVPTLEFRMNRNISSVSHTIDRRDLFTRLYPRGYGEGVNQLTIADVNGGVEYLEKNTATYGIVEDVFVDTSITDAQTLMDTAQAYLDVVSSPSVVTEVDGLDVFIRTGENFDAPRLGAVARVPIPDYGINLSESVIRVVKNDIYGKPHSVKVTLTNQVKDSVRETAALLRKSRIGQLYSQGSTTFVPIHYADNADASNALECDFYIDSQEVSINQVLCKFKLEAFRAYSQAAAASGGSTQTSNSGGSATTTSATSGYLATDTTYVTTWTENGGSGNSGSQSADIIGISSSADGSSGSHVHASGSYYAASHYHSIGSHSHELTFGHNHAIDPHSHSVTIPSHTHTVNIPDHTHGISYGIYRGTTASSVTVTVDGNAVDPSDIVNNQFDAVPYLDKDDDGKISRNTWHTISFIPNAMTRIVADIQKKTFLRAISGGNY